MKYPYPLHITGLFNEEMGIDKRSDVFSKTIFSWKIRPILLYISKLIHKIYFGKLALFT